jgi:ribosome recycling factor
VKQELRHIRKNTLDEVKALKKGSIPEDDLKRLSKEVRHMGRHSISFLLINFL